MNDKEKLIRKHNIQFRLNDLEQEAFNKYCNKYKITNRAKFVREVVMTEILVQFDRDYPSLFDTEQENPTIF